MPENTSKYDSDNFVEKIFLQTDETQRDIRSEPTQPLPLQIDRYDLMKRLLEVPPKSSDPKKDEELDFGKIDDITDQQKTSRFLACGWRPSSTKSIEQLLQMDDIDQPNETLYLITAQAPNKNKSSVEFQNFTQIVNNQELQNIQFPKNPDEGVSEPPQYKFYVLHHGKFQECADPRTATPPPQELAA